LEQLAKEAEDAISSTNEASDAVGKIMAALGKSAIAVDIGDMLSAIADNPENSCWGFLNVKNGKIMFGVDPKDEVHALVDESNAKPYERNWKLAHLAKEDWRKIPKFQYIPGLGINHSTDPAIIQADRDKHQEEFMQAVLDKFGMNATVG
jgi:hypothetical protein